MKRVIILAMAFILAAGLVNEGYSQSLRKARKNIDKEKYKDAIKEANKIIKKNPEEAEGYFILGQAQGRMGDVNNMLANFEKCNSLTTEFLGRISVETDRVGLLNYTNGHALLQKAAGEKNEEKRTGIFKEAIQKLEASLKITDELDAKVNLAIAYDNIKDNENVEKYALMVLEEDPKNKQILITLANLKFNMAIDAGEADEFKKALVYYEQYVASYPEEESQVAMPFGYCREITGDLKGAKEVYEKMYAASPDNTEIHDRLGSVRYQLGEIEGALELWNKALTSNPDDMTILKNVTIVMYNTVLTLKKSDTKPTKAHWESLLEKMVILTEKTPKDGQVWDMLVTVYANLGDEPNMNIALAKLKELGGE